MKNFSPIQYSILFYLHTKFSSDSTTGIDSTQIYNALNIEYSRIITSEDIVKINLCFLIDNTNFFIDCRTGGNHVAVLPNDSLSTEMSNFTQRDIKRMMRCKNPNKPINSKIPFKKQLYKLIILIAAIATISTFIISCFKKF